MVDDSKLLNPRSTRSPARATLAAIALITTALAPTHTPASAGTDASASRRLEAVDPMPPFHSPAGRGPDELVVYTTNTGERTGTNEHGVEAVVARGTVRRVGGNNSVIPPDGFVVSGHGQAGTWLRTSARVGAAVSLDRRTMTVTFTVDAGTAGKRRDSR